MDVARCVCYILLPSSKKKKISSIVITVEEIMLARNIYLTKYSCLDVQNYQCKMLVMTRHFSVFVGASANLLKAAISFVMSVRPHGATRIPLDGFA